MKNLQKLKTLCWILVIVFVTNISIMSCRGCHRALADYEGDVNEIYKVQNADKRLADYHWFEEQYQSIVSHKANLKMLHNSGQSVLDELMIVNNWIGEYNARVRAYDRNMWRRSDLPTHIDLITGPEDL